MATLAIDIASAIVGVAGFVIYFIARKTSDITVNDVIGFALFLILASILMFASYFRAIKLSKKRAQIFFNEYQIDGKLQYRVELTETDMIVKYKESVIHYSFKTIERITDSGGYIYVYFRLGNMLVIPQTDDTKLLIKAIYQCRATHNNM